jgi:ferredoxin
VSWVIIYSGADFTLYYKARTRAQAAFIAELERVPWRDRVEFFFSDERRLKVDDIINDCREGDHVYTCGPAGFMDAVYAAAMGRGWLDEALHREYFTAPERAPYANHPFTLRLARAGRSIPVAASQSAAEALQQAGFHVDIKCKDGLCGVCTVAYTEGAIEHRDFVLSKMQRQGKLTLCCSRAQLPNESITLDL